MGKDEHGWVGICDIRDDWEDICNISFFFLEINMDWFLKLFGTFVRT